jgi:polyvinyl alcohol dehydrogenase (cytochrome)
MAKLSAGQVARLKLKWAFGLPGATSLYVQPTVVGGRVYISSDAGYVYSLNADTGCVYWSFQAQAGVRSAITIGAAKPGSSKFLAFFGDVRGNTYAIDASNGELAWKTSVDPHPLARITASPKLYDGRLYVPITSLEEVESGSPKYECCTFRGAVAALDAETGKQIWKTYTIPDVPKVTRKTSTGTNHYGPAGAGVWNSPTIDVKRGAIYFGTGNGFSEPATKFSDAIMALDMATGKVLWSFQAHPHDIWHGGCLAAVPGRNPEAHGPAPA